MFAVGNILNRAHNYFQDFWKRFSIFNKAKQLQFNRKQKLIQKKGDRSPPGPYLARPSLLARPVTPYLAPGGRGACSPRAGHAPATSCFCRRRETPRGRHATPTSPSHTLSLSLSSPSSSPAMAERAPRCRSP